MQTALFYMSQSKNYCCHADLYLCRVKKEKKLNNFLNIQFFLNIFSYFNKFNLFILQLFYKNYNVHTDLEMNHAKSSNKKCIQQLLFPTDGYDRNCQA